MFEIRGKYNQAIIYSDIEKVDSNALDLVKQLCNTKEFQSDMIRYMPDIHAGKGVNIGSVIELHSGKVVPSFVGCDISCGMLVTKINVKNPDLPRLDQIINKRIPSGKEVHKRRAFEKDHRYEIIENLRCRKAMSLDKAYVSYGTLGGGNHFIELAVSKDGDYYLIIHSGSRNLGLRVFNYYEEKAERAWKPNREEQNQIAADLKKQGRENEIYQALKDYKERKQKPTFLYLEGQDQEDYLHDIKIIDNYADLNRKLMASIICKGMGWEIREQFTTKHNYIDQSGEFPIIRKGAVSAKEGEILLIPMNMRDGSILARGKGNPAWLNSAPHGAGRLMSRSQAKKALSFQAFEETMEGIYTTSVCHNTLDESPDAYKPMEEILSQIGETAEVLDIFKPIYNFKAKE